MLDGFDQFELVDNNDPCEWCNDTHRGVWCPISEQLRRNVMLKATIMYTMPSGMDVFVYVIAQDVDTVSLDGLEMGFFSTDGEPLEVTYSREVFEDLMDIAHEVIYEDQEGARSEEGTQATYGSGEGSADKAGESGDGSGSEG